MPSVVIPLRLARNRLRIGSRKLGSKNLSQGGCWSVPAADGNHQLDDARIQETYRLQNAIQEESSIHKPRGTSELSLKMASITIVLRITQMLQSGVNINMQEKIRGFCHAWSETCRAGAGTGCFPERRRNKNHEEPDVVIEDASHEFKHAEHVKQSEAFPAGKIVRGKATVKVVPGHYIATESEYEQEKDKPFTEIQQWNLVRGENTEPILEAPWSWAQEWTGNCINEIQRPWQGTDMLQISSPEFQVHWATLVCEPWGLPMRRVGFLLWGKPSTLEVLCFSQWLHAWVRSQLWRFYWSCAYGKPMKWFLDDQPHPLHCRYITRDLTLHKALQVRMLKWPLFLD